jgi:hypothetical protein
MAKMIKRPIKKAQNGDKEKLDKKFSDIYASNKKDSIAESKRILPKTYAMLMRRNGKSPSAEDLNSTQELINKEIVRIKKGNTPLNARGNAIKEISKVKLDKNGGAVKKKMKNGGSLTGLKASAKRVGPVDAKGAWTKVQEKTLKGSKGKASLTRDKQLGATKMKMGGRMTKKK